MKNILFLCSQNKLRSPTAEKIFKENKNINVQSAGLDIDAKNKITNELIDWADLILVMEKRHKNKLQKKFKKNSKGKKIFVLNIPDEYDYMDKGLITVLKRVVPKYIN
ncbi:phosphotyrosine protein phosphatase [Patescibacteria group bacterium]|nr:phosphotyrosine protein phosphatase [Patescibacteria group bacterium]